MNERMMNEEVMEVATSRARNPRSLALEVLRSIKRNVSVMVSEWNQTQTVFDHELNAWRTRTSDEKMENSPEEWKRLIQFMEVVILEAEYVRTFAYQQLQNLQNEAIDKSTKEE